MKPVADSLPRSLPVHLADLSSHPHGFNPGGPTWSESRLRLTMRHGSETRNVLVPRPVALIGSHAACDLVLADPAIPKRCFCLVVTSHGLYGVSLLPGRAGSRCPSFRRVSLRRSIRLGRYCLRVEILHADGEPFPCDGLPSPCSHDLGTIHWSQYGVSHAVEIQTERPLLIGRHAPCHVRPDDSTLSSVHCLVYPQPTQLWVVDLCSSNGTWVRRTRVPHASIEPGRSWKIGRTRFRWLATQPPTPNGQRERRADEGKLESTGETVRTLKAQIHDLLIEIQGLRSMQDHLQQREAELGEQGELLRREQADWIAWQETESARLSESRTALQQARTELAEAQAAWQIERENSSLAWQEFTRQQSEQLEVQRRDLQQRIDAWLVECDEQRACAQQQQEDVIAKQRSVQAQQQEIEIQRAQYAQQQQQLIDEQQRLSSEQVAFREELDAWAQVRQQSEHDQQRQAAMQRYLRNQLKQAKTLLAQMQREREQSLGQRLRTQWSLKSREEAVTTREQRLEEQTAQLAAWEAQLKRQQQELIDQRRRDLSLNGDSPALDGICPTEGARGERGDVSQAANSYLAAVDFTELLNEVLQESDADATNGSNDGSS